MAPTRSTPSTLSCACTCEVSEGLGHQCIPVNLCLVPGLSTVLPLSALCLLRLSNGEPSISLPVVSSPNGDRTWDSSHVVPSAVEKQDLTLFRVGFSGTRTEVRRGHEAWWKARVAHSAGASALSCEVLALGRVLALPVEFSQWWAVLEP